MDTSIIIPAFDPIPLPAPVWLLKGLLLLTLLLHLLAMNLLLGGSWTAFFCVLKSKNKHNSNEGKLYKEMIGSLPTLVAMTVTLGVAPLLFVQVLYGHLIYSSSVAIGWFWWLIIPMIIVAYYSLYYLKFKSAAGEGSRFWLTLIVAGLLLWVSFIFSNNFNLAQVPERFSAIILSDPSGWSLNMGDHSTIPRWLHMVIGAIAVSGIWIMWLGRIEHKRDSDYGKFKMEFGYRLFAIPTMVNILIGFVFMMTLPRNIMMRLMGQSMPETMLWVIGMGLAIWAIPVLKRSISAPQSAALPMGTALMALTVASMVILRDIIRSAYIGDFFTLNMPKVDVLWSAIVMFLIAFVIGLIVFRWLVMVYIKGGKA